MTLSADMRDRIAGVLLGQAVGDALGVPYEFAGLIKPGDAAMIGGGLGPYEPGEWSDDTQMMLCIAQVAAETEDITSPDALDRIGEAFIAWQQDGASDIGNLTNAVLGTACRADGRRVSERLATCAAELARGGQAGNGGLMRTSVVGMVALHSAARTADAAAKICALTHGAELCTESAVLWSLAVRNAVLTGELDVRVGLSCLATDRREWWEQMIAVAEREPVDMFSPNGYTVTALQAAWAAIHATRGAAASQRFADTLQLAISIGDDTDTVAAIAGGLLGAGLGASAIPSEWIEQVHGWPGLRGADLKRLALSIADGASEHC